MPTDVPVYGSYSVKLTASGRRPGRVITHCSMWSEPNGAQQKVSVITYRTTDCNIARGQIIDNVDNGLKRRQSQSKMAPLK